MADDYRKLIRRYLDGEVPDEDSERLMESIDADPEVSRLFDEMMLGGLLEKLSQEAGDIRRGPPSDPVSPAFLEDQFRQARRRSLWTLHGPGEQWRRELLDGSRTVPITATWLEPQANRDRSRPRTREATIQRVPDSPWTFRWSGTLPDDYRPMGILLTRLEMPERIPFTTDPLEFASLKKAIEHRVSPRKDTSARHDGSRFSLTVSAASEGHAEPSRGHARRTAKTYENHDFRLEVSGPRDAAGVRCRMPAGVELDFVVCEIDYTAQGGQTATVRRLVPLEPGGDDWSIQHQIALPPPSECDSPELVFRLRSLRDDDLYLLSTAELDDLFAAQKSLLLPATNIDDEGFEFAAELPFEREALANQDIAWSLQVTKTGKEPRDA